MEQDCWLHSEACHDHSEEVTVTAFVWRDGGVLHRNLTARSFGGQDDGSPFVTLPLWRGSSPVYVGTDACVLTRETHADRLVMSGHKDLIWSVANDSVDSLSLRSDFRSKSDLPAV